MASKLLDEDLEQFLKEASENRDANKFRDATRNLLVDSGQLVLTLTIHPSSQDLMITGESSIVNLIGNASLENISLANIKTAMLKKYSQNKDKKTDNKLLFSDLHQDVKKNYSEEQPVALLPWLNHVKADEWGVKVGRKVVGTYLTEIKLRNNNKYDKNEDKKPKWLPKEVNKIYFASMSRDECTIVMNAILKEFPETNPRNREHCAKKNVKPIRNVINRVRNIFSDNSDGEENNSNIPVVGSSEQKSAKKISTVVSNDLVKRGKQRNPTFDVTPVSHSTHQLDQTSGYTCSTDMDETDESEITISSDGYDSSKRDSQKRRSKKFCKTSDGKGLNSKKHSITTDDSEEESIIKSFSKTLKRNKKGNVAKRTRIDFESSDDNDRNNYNQKKPHHEMYTRSRHKSIISKDNRNLIDTSVQDTFELEEQVVRVEAKNNKQIMKNLKKGQNSEENKHLDLRQHLHVMRSNAKRVNDTSTSEILEKVPEKSHRIKQDGMEHSDLRQKIFFGKAMQLQPRGGWENWLERKKGKNCNCKESCD